MQFFEVDRAEIGDRRFLAANGVCGALFNTEAAVDDGSFAQELRGVSNGREIGLVNATRSTAYRSGNGSDGLLKPEICTQHTSSPAAGDRSE